MKKFEDKFYDDTEFAFYRITVTSENGQRQTFDGVSQYYAKEIYDQLLEQASEDELNGISDD